MRRKKHQTKSRPNAPGEEQLLELLEQIIFNLNEKNFDASIESITNLYKSEPDSPYSLNLVLCKLIYSSFVSSLKKPGLFINFIVSLMSKEENDQLISILSKYLLKLESQESYYLLEKMIKRGLIEQYFIKNKRTLYFSHYKTKKQIDELISSNPFDTFFVKNIDNISKNDWELHKQLIKEGHNPNEIAKIIRNDEIEKLQEISSQKDFDFNQTIEPSLYERCSFINQENVSLIDYAAFFSAVKCFKYLIMNNANVENTCKFAVAGGNEEIIQSCEKIIHH